MAKQKEINKLSQKVNKISFKEEIKNAKPIMNL